MAKQKTSHPIASVISLPQALTLILFLLLPLVGFYGGMKYQKQYDQNHAQSRVPAVKETKSAAKLTKIYTNKIDTVTIQYPSTWTVKELHMVSNREVDNPMEINTAILSGNEGEVTVEWGPMGFGGGCDKQYIQFPIKHTSMKICDSLLPNGDEAWGAFDNGHKDDTITQVTALAYKPLPENAGTVKAILSSILFTN